YSYAALMVCMRDSASLNEDFPTWGLRDLDVLLDGKLGDKRGEGHATLDSDGKVEWKQRRWDADGAELGRVRRVLVEAEQVRVPEEAPGGGGDQASVDEVEEALQGGVDGWVVLVGNVDEDIKGVGVAPFPFSAVGLADGLGDVPWQMVGDGCKVVVPYLGDGRWVAGPVSGALEVVIVGGLLCISASVAGGAVTDIDPHQTSRAIAKSQKEKQKERAAATTRAARMADDGNSTKRLKTSEEERIIAELRRKNAELESENEQLGLICSNLALTCKSFGLRQTASTLNWSLVEEVARQEVYSIATNAEISSLPRYVSGTTTWLSILHRFEHLLQFDVLLGAGIEHRNWDESRVYGTTNDDVANGAISSNYIMTSGSHFAVFDITGTPFIGVARPMTKEILSRENFNFFNSVHFDTFLTERTDEWGDGNVHACQYFCGNGEMIWTSFEGESYRGYYWEGWEGKESCSTGDTIGMLLNLDEGTLTVYKNNRRLGVIKDGLSGQYCWYVRVLKDQAVAIKRGALPNAEN
ncbi:hypothetical protein THAOC_35832, partial [Thalassiosira oceanica]